MAFSGILNRKMMIRDSIGCVSLVTRGQRSGTVHFDRITKKLLAIPLAITKEDMVLPEAGSRLCDARHVHRHSAHIG